MPSAGVGRAGPGGAGCAAVPRCLGAPGAHPPGARSREPGARSSTGAARWLGISVTGALLTPHHLPARLTPN